VSLFNIAQFGLEIHGSLATHRRQAKLSLEVSRNGSPDFPRSRCQSFS
jgi:hypothetical protein